MPYKGKELSMLIFLPNEMEDSTTGLEKVGLAYMYKYITEDISTYIHTHIQVCMYITKHGDQIMDVC